MAKITRTIGLSLGADLCWPLCYEEIISRLDLHLPLGDDTVDFAVERLTIEPYDLQQPCRYDMVLDRLTHWYHTSREWIKKAVILDDLYVLNNPWSLQSMEKQTTYCAMMRLGMPVPSTWMVPPKAYEGHDDLRPTLERYARLFDVGSVGDDLGYPLFIKPYDGGAWRGVNKIDDGEQLRVAYENSGKSLMHLQRSVDDWDLFVRCLGVGPQVNVIKYDPAAPLHERYCVDFGFVEAEEDRVLRDMTLTINTFFGWDFNSCECLLKNEVWHPIDFANPCPDSQVTSLHSHFPWLVKSKLRWSLFCAATKRKMRPNLDWQPFFEIAAEDRPFEEKLRAYGKLARKHFEQERFEEFCDKHLKGLDEAVWDYFGDDRARTAIRQKVESLFPDHEHDEFTDYFWTAVQEWREADAAGRS